MNGSFRLGVVAATARAGGVAPPPSSGPEWISVTRTFGGSERNPVVSMPATISAGDLLVMIFSSGSGRTWESGHPSGWTRIGSTGSSGSARLAVAYKVAAGNEGGTTLQVNLSGSSPYSTFEIHRIRAGTFHAVNPIEITAPASASSSEIDYPSLTPSWGLAATLWMSAAAFIESTTAQDISGYPFAEGQFSQNPGTSGAGVARLATSRQVIAAVSQAPGKASVLNISAPWVAMILAIQPSA